MKPIRNFFSPTPAHIRRWQAFLLFVGGLSTVLQTTTAVVPQWVTLAVQICGYTGAFLGQFAVKTRQCPEEN